MLEQEYVHPDTMSCEQDFPRVQNAAKLSKNVSVYGDVCTKPERNQGQPGQLPSVVKLDSGRAHQWEQISRKS